MTANLVSVSSESPIFDNKVVISTCIFLDEDVRASVIGFPWGEGGKVG